MSPVIYKVRQDTQMHRENFSETLLALNKQVLKAQYHRQLSKGAVSQEKRPPLLS